MQIYSPNMSIITIYNLWIWHFLEYAPVTLYDKNDLEVRKSRSKLANSQTPFLQIYKDRLLKIDWGRIKKVDKRLIDKITQMLESDLPALIDAARNIDTEHDNDGHDVPKNNSKRGPANRASNAQPGPVDIDQKEPPFNKISEFWLKYIFLICVSFSFLFVCFQINAL